MMKALEIAIEKLKALPEDKQAYAAEVIEQIAATDNSISTFPKSTCQASLKASHRLRVASSQTNKRSTAPFVEHGPEGTADPARHRRP